MRAGRMDQEWAAGRARKIVRCPATESIKIHQGLQLRVAEVKDAVAKVEQAEGGHRSDEAQDVAMPSTTCMFHASG